MIKEEHEGAASTYVFPDSAGLTPPEGLGLEFMDEIVATWNDAMERLESKALDIEADPSNLDELGAVRRILHTVKGEAAMAEFNEISEVFHEGENILEDLVARGLCPTEFLLGLKDWLQAVLAGPLPAREEDSDVPKEAPQETQKKSDVPPAKAQRSMPAVGKRMKILVAEDDLTSRTMLQAILKKWGYETVGVGDGNAAWDTLQTPDAPQLAILDWMMPGMDGLTLCRKLREQDRPDPLYLILLTARDNLTDTVEGLEAGADDYISKPYDNEVLRARVNVGRRMLILQAELRKREKLKGVLEMAGAVCHELNQPLQVVSGFSELLLLDLAEDDSLRDKLTQIKSGIDRIGQLTHKIMNITRYRAKPYMGKTSIVDIESASIGEWEKP